MSRTLQQIIDAGGPDPAWLAAALTKAKLGQMLAPQQRTVTQSSAAIVKFSALSTPIPPMRPGAIAKFSGGTLGGVGSFWAIAKGTFAADVPAEGLVIGAGNARIRLIPRPGYIVRYAQFNPGSVAETGAYYNASFTRTVYTSLRGKVCEIWVALANSASAVLSNQTANAVIADLRASGDVMQACSTVDSGAGDGTGNVAVTAASDLTANRPFVGETLGASATDPPYNSPGCFVLSRDGNLAFFVAPWTDATFDYEAAPDMPLENEYESSAV